MTTKLTTEDRENVTPQQLAADLNSSFLAYYTEEKAKNNRRKLDVVALRKRANIETTIVPIAAANTIKGLYND